MVSLILCFYFCIVERVLSKRLYSEEITVFPKKGSYSMIPKKVTFPIPRCSNPSNSSGSEVESSDGAKACISTSL